MAATALTSNPEFGNKIGRQIKRRVFASQVGCPAIAVTGPGECAVQDNSGVITDPSEHVTNYATRVARIEGCGTTIVFFMKYDDAWTDFDTDTLVIEVFGRYNSDDPWRRLYNKNSTPSITATITPSPDHTSAGGDSWDGTYKYTTPHPCDHAFDLMGCEEIVVGIRSEITGNAGAPGADDDLSQLYAFLL